MEYTAFQSEKATVRPANPFDPKYDAEILKEAMKGPGTDESAIVKLFAKRSNLQRMDIATEYRNLYEKDLIEDLKSETTGKFEDLLVALMTPVQQFYAKELRHAMGGIGRNENTLIEILCSLNNLQLNLVKEAYICLFDEVLKDNLSSHTPGNFQKLLIALCEENRDESESIDAEQAQADARILLVAGELRFGTDASKFNEILCTRNQYQIREIVKAYKELTGHSLEKAIKKEFSGDVEDGLIDIVKCLKNKARFFAQKLHDSMAGSGTRDRDLIRIIVTRCEYDMEDIKMEFKIKYKKSLESYIKDDTSGDYKKLLIELVR